MAWGRWINIGCSCDRMFMTSADAASARVRYKHGSQTIELDVGEMIPDKAPAVAKVAAWVLAQH